MVYRKLRKLSFTVLTLLLLFAAQGTSYAQFDVKWMSVGSLHNWYSAIGGEMEEGFVKEQQYGMQWPALYDYQDIQAWKGIWIGCKNFTDPAGAKYPVRVVHVGPRVSGSGEFFPVKFYMKSKFDAPAVFVDGNLSSQKVVDINSIDPNMPWDRELVSVTNSLLGLTTTRRVFQFSQVYNDNYIVNEYTFKNTGDTDGDTTTIELPTNILTDVRVFMQYRLAPCADTRYVIGNATGWGVNSTYDARGDGMYADPAGEDFRAQFVWHGKFPSYVVCDNIGGPIWTPYHVKSDTSGRLGAPQFAGVATLFCQKSADQQVDDPGQPSTTSTFSSDGNLQSNNDAFNLTKMTDEYNSMMAAGHDKRHLDKIGEKFDWSKKIPYPILPSKDPIAGTAGGLSMGDGYGPFTLKPGESVKLVLVEAVAGLSRDKAIDLGVKYKKDYKASSSQAAKDAATTVKNEAFFTGKDSLFQTFRRARANFASNWQIESGPMPPKELYVDGLGDRIALSWTTYSGSESGISGFEVYRAIGRLDSTYRLVASVGADVREYNDSQVPRGVNCYYYVVSVGKVTGATGAQSGAECAIPSQTMLRSSRYYSQTFDPTYLKRQAGAAMSDIRIVPNPFNISADANNLRFPEKRDRLFFYNLPGDATIKIYTEYGELVNTIEHKNGSGDDTWDCQTSSRQIVVSGIYIAVIKNNTTGESKILKFVVIR